MGKTFIRNTRELHIFSCSSKIPTNIFSDLVSIFYFWSCAHRCSRTSVLPFARQSCIPNFLARMEYIMYTRLCSTMISVSSTEFGSGVYLRFFFCALCSANFVKISPKEDPELVFVFATVFCLLDGACGKPKRIFFLSKSTSVISSSTS